MIIIDTIYNNKWVIMDSICQMMIIIVYVLTYCKHNTRKTKKMKNFHNSVPLNTVRKQYCLFDCTYGTSFNNAVLTPMQAMEIILLKISCANDVDTDNGFVYNTTHVL